MQKDTFLPVSVLYKTGITFRQPLMRILFAVISFTLLCGFSASLHAQSKADSLRMAVNLTDMSEKTVDTIAELSELLMNQGEARESKAWMQLGIEISEIIDYPAGERKISLNLAEYFLIQNVSDSVEVYASRAYQLAEDAEQRASALNMQANAHSQSGRHIIALGLGEGLYYGNVGMARLMFERGNYNDSINWLNRARTMAESANISSLRKSTYNSLYEAHKEAGNIRESLSWLERYNALNDSLNTAERNLLAAQYEAKFNLKHSQQQNELFRARQEQQEARLATQQAIIGFTVFGIAILMIGGVILLRTNHQRKEANRELKQSNQQLNELNETIKVQNKELEELNNIKTKLFAIVAHDLRGPLSSLQSLLYLLREHNLSEQELAEISDSLEANLHDNAAMMDNLLIWAKSQMNGIAINRREFLFENCVKSVLDQLKFQADKKSIVFETDIEDGLKLNADYDMIKLVLRNLMANAIKFSFTKSKIEVGARQEGKNIEFHVKDHGIGIAVENQPKIFADETFTSRGTNNEHGSGLGLTLSKEFIEGHGGTIRFESEKGKGTTFFVSIPSKIKKGSLKEEASV